MTGMLRASVVGMLFLAGCGGRTVDARDQWTVVIATDAPVPQFGDRVLVEVLDAQGQPACSGCRREFGVPDAWPISFGIEPLPAVPVPRLRVRLYRSAATGSDGLPTGAALIDERGSLPPARGITRVYAPLMMSCFGVPSAPGSSCDPATGEAADERELAAPPAALPAPGSWPPAATRDCNGAPPAGMVCVPGGAFLLGAPRFFYYDDASAPTPEHLVQLSPFAIDADEFTVGALRPLVAAGTVPAPTQQNSIGGSEMCTWLGKDNAANDAAPVNCVTVDQAVAACAALGERLPTEAEWEFVASNRTAETLYPWGDDDSDICNLTAVGLGRQSSLGAEATFCLATGKPPGPAPGGNPKDVTALGVRNLGGNVSERVADRFSSYAASCWNGAKLLVDPRCDVSTPPPENPNAQQSLRGSSWAGIALGTRSTGRNAAATTNRDALTGFRCAKSM